MKQTRIFGILTIFLLLVAIPSASAYVTVKTDKLAYNSGESVKFTLYNYNSYAINIMPYDIVIYKKVGLNWVIVMQDATACVALEGADCSVTITPQGSYSYIWNQKIYQNGQFVQTQPGYYRAYFAGYKSNTFRIKETAYATPPFVTQ